MLALSAVSGHLARQWGYQMCRNLTVLVWLATLASGCAATIDGKLGGRDVPRLGSANFGTADTGGIAGLAAIAAGADACRVGAGVVDLNAQALNSGASENEDVRNGFLRREVEFLNENVSVGSWGINVFAFADDDDEFLRASVEFEDQESPFVILTVCEQTSRASEDGRGGVDTGQDCFKAVSGDASFELSSDQSSLVVTSAGGLQFDDDTGDGAGTIDLNASFSRCPEIDAATAEWLDEIVAAAP